MTKTDHQITFRHIGCNIHLCNQVDGMKIVKSPALEYWETPWTLSYDDVFGCRVVKRFRTLAEARKEALIIGGDR